MQMDVVHTRCGLPCEPGGVEILDVAVLGIEEVENLDAQAQIVAELVADVGVEKRGGLDGVKFRRQQVLGPYVVDFLCLEPKLVIEVDGGQHAEPVSNDLQRTEYLKVLGYRVLRFWNHEVLGDPDAVLASIRAALVEIPSPLPSPGGRES
ncbi:MAG: endonuclease domain-containing protein [Gammaproteobacteria bacterium]